MKTDNEKIFIMNIAKQWKDDPHEVLFQLIPHDIVFFSIEKDLFHGGFERENSNFIDLPMHKDNLYYIYSNNSWTGNSVKIKVSTQEYDNEWVERYREFQFKKEVSVNIDELFIHRESLKRIEELRSKILPEISPRKEESLYALIGIFIDMLVDKSQFKIAEQRNIKPDLDIILNDGYLFNNQEELIYSIEEYDIEGCKSSTLNTVFKHANIALRSRFK